MGIGVYLWAGVWQGDGEWVGGRARGEGWV